MKKMILIALVMIIASSAHASKWEMVLDLAPLIPQGDLAESYDTPAGMGSDTGFEVGFRLRQIQNNSAWSIAMNTGRPKKYEGIGFLDDGTEDPFEVSAIMFRYSADYTYYLPAKRNSAQFFLTAGGSLIQNKYRDEYLTDGEFFEHSVNAIGANLGAGVKKGEIEFTLSYHINRFDTIRIWNDVEDYNWDYITARIGIILPNY
jgi:hypothetical protein